MSDRTNPRRSRKGHPRKREPADDGRIVFDQEAIRATLCVPVRTPPPEPPRDRKRHQPNLPFDAA